MARCHNYICIFFFPVFLFFCQSGYARVETLDYRNRATRSFLVDILNDHITDHRFVHTLVHLFVHHLWIRNPCTILYFL